MLAWFCARRQEQHYPVILNTTESFRPLVILVAGNFRPGPLSPPSQLGHGSLPIYRYTLKIMLKDHTILEKLKLMFLLVPEYEPCHEKINILNMRKERRSLASQFSAFVFAIWIVQFLYFLTPKFPA